MTGIALDTAPINGIGLLPTPPHMQHSRAMRCSVLPLRVDSSTDIPPSLPAFLQNTAEAKGDWFAVSTIGGGEFALVREINKRNAAALEPGNPLFGNPLIAYYLPLAERIVIHGRGEKKQRRKRLKPLFDHYVFVCGAITGRPRESVAELACIESKYIDGRDALLYESNQRGLRNALENIEHALKIDPSLNVGEVNHKGQKVVVIHGPLKRTTGIVEEFAEVGAMQVVYIEIEMFGRAVTLNVPREFVAPL